MHRGWLAVPLLAILATTACGSTTTAGTQDSQDGKEAPTIALLLPETKTTRYEEQDRPLFEAKVKELCPDCKVLYYNANQDAAKQQQQVEAAITNGANVLVLDAVDARPSPALGQPAKQSNDPGDRLRPADLRQRRSTTTSRSTTCRVGKIQAPGAARQARRQRQRQGRS